MQFDLTPARDVKLEFPPTAEGRLRRIVFYTAAAIAVLCGLAVVASLGVAAVTIIGQLLHIH